MSVKEELFEIWISYKTLDKSEIISHSNTGKIAVSADSDGTVEFKTIKEIGGTVPLGTIISMYPGYFNDDNKFKEFELNLWQT